MLYGTCTHLNAYCDEHIQELHTYIAKCTMDFLYTQHVVSFVAIDPYYILDLYIIVSTYIYINH